MNRWIFGATVVACLVATFLTTPAEGWTQDRGFVKPAAADRAASKRVALVIGNGRYASAPLTNPTNDARAVAGALRSLGFHVIEQHDLDQRGMKRAIFAFGESLDADSVGLFYYAGHGMQVQGRNYLIPIGAELQGEADAEIEGVDVAAVMARMENAHNRLNIVILDACRNNPFARSWRSQATGLAMMDAPNGTLVAYATAPGRVAADGEGANGAYTESLIRYILTPSMRIEDIFKRVRTEVREKTGGAQVPWESSSLEGDFYFVAPAKQTGCPAGMRAEGEGCVAIVNTSCPDGTRFQPGTGCVPVFAGGVAIPTPPPAPLAAAPTADQLPPELAAAPSVNLIDRGTLDTVTRQAFKGIPVPVGATLLVRTTNALNLQFTGLTGDQLARFYWTQLHRCKGSITRIPSPWWAFTQSDPKCDLRAFSTSSTGNVTMVSLSLGPDEVLEAPMSGVFGESLPPKTEAYLLSPTTATWLIRKPVQEVITLLERRYKTKPVRIDKAVALGHPWATVTATSEDSGFYSLSITRNPLSDQLGQQETTLLTVIRRQNR